MREENQLSLKKVEELFNTIRASEIKNDKTGRFDDKQMAAMIQRYLVKQAKADLEAEK